MEKKNLDLLKEHVAKLKKAVKREDSILKEIENDKGTKLHIKTLSELPQNSKYASLVEWEETIDKQITRGNNSLNNIKFKRVLIEALDAFIATQN